MLDRNNQNRLAPQTELNQDLEAFYSYLIDLGNCSHDDLDLQFRYLGSEVAMMSLKNDCRGIDRSDIERLATDSFMRGVLACFCYYRDGRPAIAKLLERQALEITEHDLEMYQERRLLPVDQLVKLKEDIGLCKTKND